MYTSLMLFYIQVWSQGISGISFTKSCRKNCLVLFSLLSCWTKTMWTKVLSVLIDFPYYTLILKKNKLGFI